MHITSTFDEVARMSQVTRETAFREIPADRCDLLRVSEDVAVATALREADDLEDAVHGLLSRSIETGIDGSTAYLCVFAPETVQTLRRAWAVCERYG